ncbi:MAG: histidinol dehydrogenase [Deltaproteobacteria bacterium]|nr:histidinol dehydrogenase [Deltaproteobacteria bacterium]
MNITKTDSPDFKTQLIKIGNRGKLDNEKLRATVKEIVDKVAAEGDKALFDYTEKFDGYKLTAGNIMLSEEDIEEAASRVGQKEWSILKLAADRIEKFHAKQVIQSWSFEDEPGIELGQRILPLSRVGIYTPGGTAAYPSTLLMAAIPAKIAGVGEIIIATPTKGGKPHPLIAAAIKICGIKQVFKIGGAQAIAALSYGTESVPQVDKIVGPGNAYVTTAKQMIYGRTAIDMIAAGPSEVVIIADGKADPAFAAADMLAQAEHDALAGAILLTPDEAFARQVADEIDRQLEDLPRKAFAGKALTEFGAIIVTRNMDEAAQIANDLAPEHLELLLENPRQMLEKIKNAGAVLLGYSTPAALGDYMAGPNHILPTERSARFSSPLGVYDFIKRTSVISFDRMALEKYGPQTAAFADMEGLSGHGKSISVRLSRK